MHGFLLFSVHFVIPSHPLAVPYGLAADTMGRYSAAVGKAEMRSRAAPMGTSVTSSITGDLAASSSGNTLHSPYSSIVYEGTRRASALNSKGTDWRVNGKSSAGQGLRVSLMPRSSEPPSTRA